MVSSFTTFHLVFVCMHKTLCCCFGSSPSAVVFLWVKQPEIQTVLSAQCYEVTVRSATVKRNE